VFGRRDVVFMHPQDLAARGLQHGDQIDLESAFADGTPLHLKSFTAISYEIAPGSVAAYYPEANVLLPLSVGDKQSGTPSYKSIPVRIARSVAMAQAS
jgi:anaerobic selenocysteine-containing dehydrogenase